MKSSYDVVIVGGGVNGSSTAYWLASQPGFDGTVLVVERDPSYEGAPSARASGGIRQQFSTPENVHMGLFGAEFVKSIEQRLSVDGESTGVVFREQGYLLLATEQSMAPMRQCHAIQLECGADIVFKDTRALESEFPWINTDGLEGAFFGASNEGWVDPYTLLQAFKRKARACGVEYVTDTALEALLEGQRVTGVRLRDGGEVAAGVVVNTAGASGARALAEGVGIELPIESRQRCTFVFECREDISKGQLTVLPDGVAWRPEGSRFIATIAPPPERDPVTHEFNVDHELFDEIIWPSLARWVPAFEAIKVVHAYSCHYDFNTLDENLIIGAVPGVQGFLVATGLSGHGMQQSPAIGRALYELIAFGEYRSLDLSRMGYGRVLDNAGLHEINCW